MSTSVPSILAVFYLLNYSYCLQNYYIGCFLNNNKTKSSENHKTVYSCFNHCKKENYRYSAISLIHDYTSEIQTLICQCSENITSIEECDDNIRLNSCCEHRCDEYYCGDSKYAAVYDTYYTEDTFEGCFNATEKLTEFELMFNGEKLSFETCQSVCKNEGYIYTSLTNLSCYCGVHVQLSKKILTSYCVPNCENVSSSCYSHNQQIMKVYRTTLDSLRELHRAPAVVTDIPDYVEIRWMEMKGFKFKLQYWNFETWHNIIANTDNNTFKWYYKKSPLLKMDRLYKVRVFAISETKNLSGSSLIFKTCPAFSSKISLQNISSTSVFIKWTSIVGIKEYIVRIYAQGIVIYLKNIVSTTAFLHGLKPYTAYKVQITLKTMTLGQNQACYKSSKLLSFQTLCKEPSSAPLIRHVKTNLTGMKSQKSQICFDWEFQGIINCKELTVVNYYYKHQNNGNYFQAVVVLNPSQKNGSYICINNLDISSEYLLRADVQNNKGFHSTMSEEISITTPDQESHIPLTIYRISRTTDSLNIGWTSTNTKNTIIEFKVNIFAVSTYKGYFKNKNLSVNYQNYNFSKILPQSQTHYIFYHLFPATLYNVSLSASTSNGFGLPISANFWTEIKDPPLPHQPKIDIEKSTENTLFMHLHPVKKVFGSPISAYQVIVKTEESVFINKSLLFDYFEAAENQLPYYITAEILPQNLNHTFIIGDGLYYESFFNAPLKNTLKTDIYLNIVSSLDEVIKMSFVKARRLRKVAHNIQNTINKSTVYVLSGLCTILIIMILASTWVLIKARKQKLANISKHHHVTVYIDKKSYNKVLTSDL